MSRELAGHDVSGRIMLLRDPDEKMLKKQARNFAVSTLWIVFGTPLEAKTNLGVGFCYEVWGTALMLRAPR